MDIERIRSFIAEDHKNIDGWFFPLDQLIFFELLALQNQLRVAGDLAEIGIWQGKSLVLLSLLKSADQRLIGFDLFDRDHQVITEENLDRYGCKDGVILKKGLTTDLAVEDLDGLLSTPLRFLHIDAGHEYHEVLEQLELFCPYVAERGIIAMDDYQDREFPGIEAAVLDFAERDRPARFVPFLAGGNKMYLCSASAAPTLQKLLVAKDNFKDRCRLTRVKDFNILILRSKLPVASEVIASQIDSTTFPLRDDSALTLNQKALKYSQLNFGSGE
jgi:hypothetical protein